MLGFIGIAEPAGDEIEVSFARPPLSERSGVPMLLAFGDDDTGPLMGLFFDAPAAPDHLDDPPELTPAHGHAADNFRICMVGELWVGAERYHRGEFRIQESGRPYGADGDAPHRDGNWRLIMFADRRGHRVRPVNPELRAQIDARREETLAHMAPYVRELLDDDDKGVVGMGTNLGPRSRIGHIDGSFADAESWDDIGRGAKVAAALLGVPDRGPLVMLVRTRPGEVAAPAGVYDSDTFRCVIAGTAQIGERELHMGDAMVKAAGRLWPAVVAGADGLDECFVVGDRRGAVPDTADLEWAVEMRALVDKLRDDIAVSVAASR
jgi:hypothetical protein